ncbi:hypothetical protein OH77DRAFT_151818 [Trametes cingulata]|nr:hypothetical protein OH77DRAFT_151818 [Trametes cingulata]
MYCLLLVVVVAIGFKSLPTSKSDPAANGTLSSSLYVIGNACLVPIIGMYPVLVILLVALEKSCDDSQLILRSSLPSTSPVVIQLNRVVSMSTVSGALSHFGSESEMTRQDLCGVEADADGKGDQSPVFALDTAAQRRVRKIRRMPI